MIASSRPAELRSVASSPAVVDLCCGMGGFSLAAQQCGMRVVAGVDANAQAIRTFENNFPNATAYIKSVRSTNTMAECSKLLAAACPKGEPRIVISGPPCQGFSAAGSRDPVDKRNQILGAVARAIVAIQPSCALIENVAMLLGTSHATRLKSFRTTLEAGGYFTRVVLLDASEYGVAQRRKRVFVFATQIELTDDTLRDELEAQKQPAVNVSQALSGLPTPVQRPAIYSDEDESGDVFNHFAMRHSPEVAAKIAAIPQGKGPMSYRRLHPDRASNTLFSGNRAPPAHHVEHRSITVREAARLQGFPDAFRIYGSFANQMGQVTNAVPPPLAAAALRVLQKIGASPR